MPNARFIPRRPLWGPSLVGFALAGLWTGPAAGFESEVRTRVAAQFYGLSGPFGDRDILRRRYTHTLSLGLYELAGGERPGQPRLDARVRLRLDGDLGQSGAERNPETEDRFVPELREAPIDLMYGYVEGRNYLGGALGFRLGRQYVTDALGWWSFDGGLVQVTTPLYFRLVGYGGFEQRGGLPLLSTDRFEADGVYRGERFGLEPTQYPEYLDQDELAPAYGFGIESSGIPLVHASLGYRRVINRDVVATVPFVDDSGRIATFGDNRTSTERIGSTARVEHADVGSVGGSTVYDIFVQKLSQYDANVDWYATPWLTVGAGYEYYLPTFDADSIWNWFSHNGMSTAEGRVSARFTRRTDAALTGGVRFYATDGDPSDFPSTENPVPADAANQRSADRVFDHFGTVAGNYRWGDGSVGLRAMGEKGGRGHRGGGDVTLVKLFDDERYDSKVIVSVYDWSDGLRPDRDATSFSYVLGGGVSPRTLFSQVRFGAEWEHTTNRLVGQRYRVLATLAIEVSK